MGPEFNNFQIKIQTIPSLQSNLHEKIAFMIDIFTENGRLRTKLEK